jgi:uncharacterized protein
MTTRRILIFLAIAFGVPWIADLGIYLSGAMKDNPMQWVTLANTIAICTPALANVVTRLITREGWGHLWLWPNLRRTASVRDGWKFYLAAWLLPPLAVCVGAAIFYLIFPQSFDPNLGEVRKLFASVPAIAADPWMGMLSIVLQIMFISLIINGIASIGEDFGWRAYLLPKLMERFGGADAVRADAVRANAVRANRSISAGQIAALLVGVIWSVWHWPLFFLGTLAGAPAPNLLAYLVFTCALSVFLAWVTLRSGSVWPASIGHGMTNAASVLPVLLFQGQANVLLGPAPTGLIGGLGFVLLALVLFFNRKALAGQPEAAPASAQAVDRGTSA